MTTKTFLTSAVAMGFIAPVMAAPTNTGSFPAGGLMQADYTYTNAATSTNMDGVYEGTVNAEAQYENILYTIGAGKYLPAGAETVIDCNQSGYFCPGLQSQVQYDENNPQGLTSCSTATNGAYTLSDGTGSSADSCYRTCSGNVTIAHATGVTGNDYYGNGTDTCEPTACENGWHVKAAVTTPNLTSLIGVSEKGNDYGYISNNGQFKAKESKYGITQNGEFVVDYGTKGIIKGHGRCSTRNVANPWYDQNGYIFEPDHFVSNLADETGMGQYCYCLLDSYTPLNGSAIALSTPWVFVYDFGGAEGCAGECADGCAADLWGTNSSYLALRAAVFGSVTGGGSGTATCEANTITINWGDTDLIDVTTNNAGTVTYGGNINTPVKAQTKAGKRFTGWRFSKPTQTNLP